MYLINYLDEDGLSYYYSKRLSILLFLTSDTSNVCMFVVNWGESIIHLLKWGLSWFLLLFIQIIYLYKLFDADHIKLTTRWGRVHCLKMRKTKSIFQISNRKFVILKCGNLYLFLLSNIDGLLFSLTGSSFFQFQWKYGHRSCSLDKTLLNSCFFRSKFGGCLGNKNVYLVSRKKN